MAEFVHARVVCSAWIIAAAAGWLAACAGPPALPALVLQVSQRTRARVTERSFESRRELVFAAGVEIALERAEVVPVGIEPARVESDWVAPVSCGPPSAALCAWEEAEVAAAWIAVIEQGEVVP